MVDIKEFVDKGVESVQEVAARVDKNVLQAAEEIVRLRAEVVDLKNEVSGYLYDVFEEAGGVVEDAQTFFKNHKVACFVAAGIEVAIIVLALLI
jgi:L-serine deaminase